MLFLHFHKDLFLDILVWFYAMLSIGVLRIYSMAHHNVYSCMDVEYSSLFHSSYYDNKRSTGIKVFKLASYTMGRRK
jgi:hypothetical protein